MTHTHHRRGSKKSLKGDFVVLAMIDPAVKAQHKYKGPLRDRVKKLIEIFGKHNPVAIAARTSESDRRLRYLKGWNPKMDGGIHRSATIEDVITCKDIEGIGHAVYIDIKDVEEVIDELKKADLGISIVVSGIFDEVFDMCKEIGIRPHTVNMSLGTWGKKQLLPRKPVLKLCTMCGHALISSKLAEDMIDQVSKNIKTSEEAAVELGKQCTCNIFNTVRGSKILRRKIL
jgi:hypothetical protein